MAFAAGEGANMRIVMTRRGDPLQVPDGINIFIVSLADHLLREGHEVSVVSGVASVAGELPTYYEVSRFPKVISLSGHARMNRAKLALLWATRGRRVVAALKPDLVLVNGAVPASFAGTTCTVSHDLEQRVAALGNLWRRLYKSVSYRCSDFTSVTCSELKPALARELWWLQESDIRVIPTCIVADSYSCEPLEHRSDAVLHLGTADYKNPLATVRAFTALGERHTELFITGPPSAALEAHLRTLQPPVRERIKLLGYVSASELKRLLASVRVLCVPSQYVAPVASPTVLESFASGTPVVGSTGISRDLLRPGVNGYSCDPQSESEIVAAMAALLDDDGQWLSFSAQALASAREFDAPSVAEAYLGMADKCGARAAGDPQAV
jgi:glycosyltransferase involved in cell wall biosynthesis